MKNTKHFIGGIILLFGIVIFLYSTMRKSKPDEGKNVSRNYGIAGAILMFIGAVIWFVKFK